MKTAEKHKILTANVLELSFGDQAGQAIEAAKESYKEYPKAPTKPALTSNMDSKQAKQYAADLEAYEKLKAVYDKEKAEAREHNTEVDHQIELYIKEVSGLNKYVPADKRAKVWSKAWDDGHSSGYHEVYLCLTGLVDLFS